MWFEIICGLIIYKFYRCFVSDDDDVLDVETSDSKALFSVGDRLAKLYGGKVYVGLRIPDADTASPQTIDLVLVSKGTTQSSNFPSEVVTYNQLMQLKPEPKNMFSGWIKGAFRGGKKEMQESIYQKLDFILSTSPMWDRLELEGRASASEWMEVNVRSSTEVLFQPENSSKVRKFKLSSVVSMSLSA
ncbi:hypothetical protein C1H46_033842 [Malus baccata]|uniref:Uncharacterized protein n=1 Tax=Malus baccata TaxID=106549 RepID=A0A540L2A7_MALBA|nr:hypothetical protein C1H46_033842 [Malus baccata]